MWKTGVVSGADGGFGDTEQSGDVRLKYRDAVYLFALYRATV